MIWITRSVCAIKMFQSNCLFTGFPTLLLLVHTISSEFFPSSASGKLFEGGWRKNEVKRLLHWLAILDCDSILGLLQSCELLAVGCPRLWVPRSHWSIASSPIGRQQLRLDSLELKFHWSQISPSGSGSGSGFGAVFATISAVVLFCILIQGQMVMAYGNLMGLSNNQD